jgi:1,4-dihydroxy-2-naphthoate octaprenyltransferase
VNGTLGAWLLASRPRTLPAAAAPVVVGSAVAFGDGGFRAGPASAALLGALLIQVGTNLVNDVADFERGTDTAERVGPLRVTQAGLLAPRAVKWGAAAAFGLATLCGVYLAAVAGWPVVAIGLVSIFAGIAYTAGPYPLAHHGLGDLFVLLFFGFVAVCGTVFVQLGRVPPLAWGAALPVGALATAILVVNNVRDVETDRAAGRRTLPVVLGRSAGVFEYIALLAVAQVAPFVLVAFGAPLGALLPAGTLPSAVRLAKRVATGRGPALNAALAGTAQLLLLYALLFAAGIVAASWNRP